MNSRMMLLVLGACLVSADGQAKMTVVERYKQWNDLWPAGRHAHMRLGYGVGGRFRFNSKKLGMANSAKWLMTGSKNTVAEIGGWGSEEWEIVSLCNDSRAGYWWMMKFSDGGALQTRLRAGGNPGLGYDFNKKLSREQYSRVSDDPEANGFWQRVFNTSPEKFEQWMKDQNEESDKWVEKYLGAPEKSGDGLVYHVDLTKKCPERDQLANLASGDANFIDQIESIVYSRANEFRSRLNLIESRPRTDAEGVKVSNCVGELYYGDDTVRRGIARHVWREYVNVKEGLKSVGRSTTPRDIYLELHEANRPIWTDLTKLTEAASNYYYCCKHLLPHASERIWGMKGTAEIRCGERKDNECWTFDAECLNGLKSSDFNQYIIRGNVVLRRRGTVTRKMEGDKEPHECYWLEIVPAAEICGETVKTSIALSPLKGSLNPEFFWDAKSDREEDRFIYVDVKSHFIQSFCFSFVSKVGHTDEMALGIKEWNGLLLDSSSEVRLKLTFELVSEDDDWKNVVREATPFVRGWDMRKKE